MNRVFILEECKRDFEMSSAEQYGVLTHVYVRGDRRHSIWSREFIEETLDLFEKMNFDPERDYFVLAGSTVSITTIACGLVSKYGSVNLLGFCARERAYVVIRAGAVTC